MAEMTVRSVGVLSVAKIQGLLMMVIGLIIGVIYGLIFMISGAAMSSLAPREEGAIGGAGSIIIGLIIMVAVPIFYGCFGFIGEAIGGLIYNLAVGVVGGIKLNLESDTPAYAPPPPQQWAPYQQS